MRVVVFCTVHTGLLGIQHAISNGLNVERMIGLSPASVNNKDLISGYIDVGDFCKRNGIRCSYVDDYSLKSESETILGESPDLIWVAGWQRLLPERFLNIPLKGVIGAHGSCDGILRGRGRSPQNWAILMGKEFFEVSLFKIEPGVDSGPTVLTKTFPLLATDTIVHSYAKTSIICGEGMLDIYSEKNHLEEVIPQVGEPEYFPKRTIEDGFIDWNMDYVDICNQVRALTIPYPCARTRVLNGELMIISATPLDCGKLAENGQVIDIFESGQILVQAENGGVLIESIEGTEGSILGTLKAGYRLESVPMKETIRNVIRRFEQEFSGKNLNSSLLRFLKERDLWAKS